MINICSRVEAWKTQDDRLFLTQADAILYVRRNELNFINVDDRIDHKTLVRIEADPELQNALRLWLEALRVKAANAPAPKEPNVHRTDRMIMEAATGEDPYYSHADKPED